MESNSKNHPPQYELSRKQIFGEILTEQLVRGKAPRKMNGFWASRVHPVSQDKKTWSVEKNCWTKTELKSKEMN